MTLWSKRKTLFRSLRLSVRFIVPLAIALAILAYSVVPLVDRLYLRWSVRDMDIRAKLIASTLQEPLTDLLQQGNKAKINTLFARALRDERLFALGYCDENGSMLIRTPTFPKEISCASLAPSVEKSGSLLKLSQGQVHVAASSLAYEGTPTGTLILVHDMSFVERRSTDTRKYILLLFVVLGVVTSLITVFVAHLSWRGWMEGVRAMLRGEGILRPFSRPTNSELQPLVGDLRTLLRSLDAERRFADDATISWTPDTLRDLLHKQLSGDQIIVVSNREPYIHRKVRGELRYIRPASGSGNGRRTGHAGLLRHMDRPRQRNRRSGDRGSARPGHGSSRTCRLHTAPHLVDQGRRGRLLLRFCQ